MVTAESPLSLVLNDPIQRIEGLLTVPTEDVPPQVVPFRLTRIQRDLLQRILAYPGRRRVVVKPRQVKVSSVLMARNYTDVMLTPNMNLLVVCQDDDTTSLFRNRAHHHYADLEAVSLAPRKGVDNEYEMVFPVINSRIVFRTASRTGGRAYTFHRVHGTEVAYWANAAEVLSGILPSVPPDGEVDLESTSGGPYGAFFDIVQDADAGSPEWDLVFYPWWWEPKYVANPAVYLDGKEPLSERELFLQKTHSLTDEQLAFRRAVKLRWASLGADAPPAEREFAEDLETAFSAGRGAAFTAEELAHVKHTCRDPIFKTGELWVWREPMPGEGFVIGADIATGAGDADYSAAVVLDKAGVQVAGYYGHIDAFGFAKVLNDLGVRYNEAYLVPEGWPGEGAITANALHHQYRYRRLHYDLLGGESRPGFVTTQQTRKDLVQAILEAVKFSQVCIQDERLYKELRSLVWFVRKERPGALRKLQAGPGAHDDYVVACGLAYRHISHVSSARAGVKPVGRGNWIGY